MAGLFRIRSSVGLGGFKRSAVLAKGDAFDMDDLMLASRNGSMANVPSCLLLCCRARACQMGSRAGQDLHMMQFLGCLVVDDLRMLEQSSVLFSVVETFGAPLGYSWRVQVDLSLLPRRRALATLGHEMSGTRACPHVARFFYKSPNSAVSAHAARDQTVKFS